MPLKSQKRRPLSFEKWKEKLKLCKEAGWYSIHVCDVCGTYRYAVHHGCGMITCPECARDESRKISARLMEHIKYLQSKKKSGFAIRVVTLTLKTSGNLDSDVKKLKSSIKKLWDKINCDGAGFFCVMEVGQSYNVHAHCLYYGPFISQSGLSELWLSITNNSSVVWIELIRERKIKNAVAEIAKYVTKGVAGNDKNDIYIYEIYKAFYGKRRIVEYGCFLGVASTEPTLKRCPVCGSTDTRVECCMTREEFEQFKKTLDSG